MDLDLDKLLLEFESLDENETKKPTYSDLAHLLYKNLNHSDYIDILDEFESDSSRILEYYNLETENKNLSESYKKDIFKNVLFNYAEVNDWFILYSDNLENDLNCIINEFFNKE